MYVRQTRHMMVSRLTQLSQKRRIVQRWLQAGLSQVHETIRVQAALPNTASTVS
jgi:hypothetical protein